jgi:hypothetical protein
VPVERPRRRAAGGSGELPVPSYELFSDTAIYPNESRTPLRSGRPEQVPLTQQTVGPHLMYV